MYFLWAGILTLLMKDIQVDPVAAWPWWGVLSPFGMAVVCWARADKSGYTQRKEMDKLAKRKQCRLNRQREAIGTPSSKRKK